ncbi:hypothetical protein CCMSSC00406_0010378 [Pleurotus cornucopiae]|uniref:Uncharacterized protein n=1 Tax=Pleurotus cornucopiae TaxID=5321 RepID=A0ACB7IWX2_PLECO|nr:hypothetical protein CCMSSC00406_0010378 [Pleurotus cornucopiae]
MQLKLSSVLILGSLLPLLLQASVLAPRSDAEDTTDDLGPLAAIAIGGLVAVAANVASALILDLIHSGIGENKNIGKYVSTRDVRAPPSQPHHPADRAQNPHSVIENIINDAHSRDPSLVLVAVKAFVPVTGQESLGILGHDWGSVWIPVQTSLTEAETFVVWWSKHRGRFVTVHNPANSARLALARIPVRLSISVSSTRGPKHIPSFYNYIVILLPPRCNLPSHQRRIQPPTKPSTTPRVCKLKPHPHASPKVCRFTDSSTRRAKFELQPLKPTLLLTYGRPPYQRRAEKQNDSIEQLLTRSTIRVK